MLDDTDAEKLLDHLCLKLGFCLDPEKKQSLMLDLPQDVDSFTDAVFRAEGLNPETVDKHLYRQVKAEVLAAFRRAEDMLHT